MLYGSFWFLLHQLSECYFLNYTLRGAVAHGLFLKPPISNPLFFSRGSWQQQTKEVSKHLTIFNNAKTVLLVQDQGGIKPGWRCNHAAWTLVRLWVA